MWTVRVSIAAAALVLAACGDAVDGTTDPAAGAPDDRVESRTGGVLLPDTQDLPDTDFSRHIVPLDDIHFDTFDGRSLPLSRAESGAIERLRDVIPPIERPVYVGPDRIDILADDDLVLGYVAPSEQAYAYPIKILNFHEIVNEEFDGVPLVVTYCPLCRSGVVYDRRLDGRELTFGNTSALFDNDMVMYDHQTNSYWWHIAGRGLVGELSGAELDPLPSSTTTWADWLERHPDTLVLSTDTGFSRDYEVDPFVGFQPRIDAGQRPFPDAEASRRDDRLDDGAEVVGVVIEGEARAYAVGVLGDAAINDEVAGIPLVVFSSGDEPTGVVYDRRVDGVELTFVHEEGAYRDEQTGSIWALDGRAHEGELTGTQLEPVASRFSFWFAFNASFPEAEVIDTP
jgi:hypothetical protein